MKRKCVALLSSALAGTSVFLSGCYDKVELEQQAFVTALGFDKGPNNTIDVTVRTAVPSKLSSSGGGGGGGGGGGEETGLSGSKPITVRAHSITEAMNLVNTSVERRLSLVHCGVIIFGEDLAKDGVAEPLQTLSRYHEFRQTTALQLAHGKASEVMNTQKPMFEQTDVRLAEGLSQLGRQTGLVPRTTIHDFLNNLTAVGEDPFMPILAVNQKVKKQEDQEKAKEKGGASTKGSQMESGSTQQSDEKPKLEGSEPKYTAGDVIRLGGNPVEYLGTAVFKGDRFVTTLDGVETRMFLAMRGELERVQIEIKSPFNQSKYTGIEISRISPPIFHNDLKSNPIKISVELDMEGDLYGDQAGTDYSNESNIRTLEKQVNASIARVENQMMRDVFHNYQSDPFGIFREARGTFLTYSEMQNYAWHEKLKTAEVNVRVDFKLRRSGLLLSPIPNGKNEK